MKCVNTSDMIAAGETLTVEFKREVNDTHLVRTVACLANGEGGALLTGIDDDGTVVGAKPRHGSVTDPKRLAAMI